MKSMPLLLSAIGALVGSSRNGASGPITGGTTQVALTVASTLSALGASVNPLGTATLSDTNPPVATFPITGGAQRVRQAT